MGSLVGGLELLCNHSRSYRNRADRQCGPRLRHAKSYPVAQCTSCLDDLGTRGTSLLVLESYALASERTARNTDCTAIGWTRGIDYPNGLQPADRRVEFLFSTRHLFVDYRRRVVPGIAPALATSARAKNLFEGLPIGKVNPLASMLTDRKVVS